jgi:Family of unknown function (DUF5941)/CDP-alcohol phosphatidyltransferase
MTRVIVFATAPAADGGIAAALRLGDGTPLERLIVQLEAYEVHVIARPSFASALDSLLPNVTVHVSPDAAGDLHVVAQLADSDLVLLPGELITQPSPLERLGVGTGALTTAERSEFPVRAAGGTVLSASSSYHWVASPSAYFAGVLRVDAADLPALLGQIPKLDPEGDVVSLLLTALVRSGTRVAARDARTQFWARPGSKEDAEGAARELESYDEDRARLEAAVKAQDGFFTTFFVSSYSKYVARAAARRGLTPNQITVLSMCVGIAAAALFALGHRWSLVAGAVLLQVAFMLDCVDGQLARYTRTFSRFGAWLDSVFDRGKEYLVYAGLAIGSVRGFGTNVWTLAAAALALQTVRHMFEFSYWDVHYKALANAPQPPLDQPGDRPGQPPGEATSLTRAPAAVHEGDGLATRTLGISRLLDKPPGIHWIKKMIVFPIGERFAVISLTAALFTPRTTFIVLLVWGGIGGIYSLSAHLMHTVARRSGYIESSFVSALRDDGFFGRHLQVRTRFSWLAPGVIRALEYGVLILTAALAHGPAMKACFALLAVLAFHHYDTVYRLRQQGAPPPAWVSLAGGGWDGRIILAIIALLAAVTTAGMAVAAGLLAMLYVGESVSSWTHYARADLPPTDADEEDENE